MSAPTTQETKDYLLLVVFNESHLENLETWTTHLHWAIKPPKLGKELIKPMLHSKDRSTLDIRRCYFDEEFDVRVVYGR